VGYRGRDNLLRVVECKSYMDSRGVALRAFNGSDAKLAERFKIFHDDNLREVVFRRLRELRHMCSGCERQAVPGLWADRKRCGS
jgi:hypothetical protein